MSEPFVGQIIAVGFNYAPPGWALCAGQSVSISQYQTLFYLIGTTYGGDGVNTFNLPDLRGRAAIHQGQGPGLSNHVMGEVAGSETVTLNNNQMPQHTHAVMGTSGTANSAIPTTTSLLGSTANGIDIYHTPVAPVNLAPASIGPAPGSSLPHENQQPYQVINYIIALNGIFPSQG